MFPLLKFYRAFILLLVLSGVVVVEVEATNCDTFNRILISGHDLKNPFAAVDTLILPNALHCEIFKGNLIENEYAFYRCDWGLTDEVAERIRDLSREREKIHSKMLKGYISREEYEKEKFRIYARMDKLRGGPEEVVVGKYMAGWAEMFYALKNCFDSGAIQDGDEYRFGRLFGLTTGGEFDQSPTLMIYWQKEGSCGIHLHARELFDSGFRLEVTCPSLIQ